MKIPETKTCCKTMNVPQTVQNYKFCKIAQISDLTEIT